MCSVSTAHEEEEKSCIGREKFSDLYNRDCWLLLLLCCRAITISLQTQDPDTICIPKYNNRIFLHLFRGEIMCYPEYWVNNNECPRKYPKKPIRHKTAQTLHFQWSIILCTKLPLPPHRLELRNKQVRERQRERQRDGETLTSWEISTPPLMNSFPLRPNTCTRTVFSAIPILKSFSNLYFCKPLPSSQILCTNNNNNKSYCSNPTPSSHWHNRTGRIART